ncbi:MAG: Ldh family oxidoreductase [Cryobacterium sp.]|nr:Ldh family oxidoreductase [Cryobacterium sp.]
MPHAPEARDIRVESGWLTSAIRAVFRAEGFSDHAALTVAEGLVSADLAGVTSHGAMLVPMYVARIRAGSVSRSEKARVVADSGAVAVLDAEHGLGHLSGLQAMSVAIEKARDYGIGMTTVRHGFHFGRAATYVEMATAQQCIGITMANTRPLMPAVGGAEPVVGNNPIALGTPSSGGSIVLDMALSEVALGKIRMAEATGRSIPDTWATDAHGVPTTDPRAAIDGMLLPTGGAKGFGLALMVDVLTGVLSGGSSGNDVKGLYADLTVPNDCAHTFVAINIASFGDPSEFQERLGTLTRSVLASKARPGVSHLMLPGERELTMARDNRAAGIAIEQSILDKVLETARLVGADIPDPVLVGGGSRS